MLNFARHTSLLRRLKVSFISCYAFPTKLWGSRWCFYSLGEYAGFIKASKMKFSFSRRYLRWPWGDSISVCISLSSHLQHTSEEPPVPFPFIIHIYSALTEILIFDGDELEKCKDGFQTCGDVPLNHAGAHIALECVELFTFTQKR